MQTNVYSTENLLHLNSLKSLVPEILHAYATYNSAVLKAGALNRKEKETIALSLASAIQCPYCIDIHTRSAKTEGASLEELSEAIFIAAAVKGESTFMQQEEITGQSNELNECQETSKNFFDSAFQAGKLSPKMKEIIALAVSHLLKCSFSIKKHTKNAKAAGVSQEEQMEAIFIASVICSGGVYMQMANMISVYNES
jgi:AhpD family alkylhydroperoxidase